MIKRILVLSLSLIYFCPILALAETTKSKQNFVTKEQYKGHTCCQMSRIGGWTKKNTYKSSSTKEKPKICDLEKAKTETEIKSN